MKRNLRIVVLGAMVLGSSCGGCSPAATAVGQNLMWGLPGFVQDLVAQQGLSANNLLTWTLESATNGLLCGINSNRC